jgi:hypothetical protein
MATAQKRGFRLPWGGGREETPTADREAGDAEAAELARRLGAATDDLGEGPFARSTATPVAEPAPGSSDAADEAVLATQADPADTGGSDASGNDPEAPDEVPAERLEAVTEGARSRGAGGREVPPVARMQDAWPESDRHTAGPLAGAAGRPSQASSTSDVPAEPAPHSPTAHSPEAAPATRSRRDNPLVAGLVRAMRDAAEAARSEALANLHDQVAASEEAIKTTSAATAGELRKEADSDVAAIKEWSRAELARVREETERRIEARKAQLVEETEAEAQAAADRIRSLHATVEAFEGEMAAFFETLLAEEDPARLAGLAEQMPVPPALIADGSGAPAESHEGGEPGGPGPLARAGVGDAGVGDAGVGDAGDGADAETTDAAPTEAEALDADAAAAAEAEALAGLDRQTNLVVSGLSSVAAIASFKGALLNVEGVSAVSVTAGEAGEVLFSVTHDGEVDLRDAIRTVESFETQVTADDGTMVSLVARESA